MFEAIARFIKAICLIIGIGIVVGTVIVSSYLFSVMLSALGIGIVITIVVVAFVWGNEPEEDEDK